MTIGDVFRETYGQKWSDNIIQNLIKNKEVELKYDAGRWFLEFAIMKNWEKVKIFEDIKRK